LQVKVACPSASSSSLLAHCGDATTPRIAPNFCGSLALGLCASLRRRRSQWLIPSHSQMEAVMPRRKPDGSVNDDQSYFKPLCDGDVLSASLSQRMVVGATLALLVAGLAKVARCLPVGGSTGGIVLACAIAVFLAVEFADFGTGVYHWSVDNYGNKHTPVVGSQIEAFQGHHEEPWTITYRDFCNNCYPTCIATMPFLLSFILFVRAPYTLLWGVVACGGIAFCQEFHKWSHTIRSQCHPVVNWIQERRLLVARTAHLRHHKPPFETNYCIVTGHMNPVLDKTKFFRGLEAIVARLTGVLPRCQTGARFDHLVERKSTPFKARSFH